MSKVEGAARELEGFFLRQILREAKIGGSDNGGSGASTFQAMFSDAIADEMSKAGGIGLAAMVEAQMTGAPPAAVGGSSRASPAHAALRYQASSAETSTPTHLSSGFGVRRDPIDGSARRHDGVDVAAPLGSVVVAAQRGTVLRAESAGGYGNLVVIDHGGGRETRYAHLGSLEVKAGDTLAEGAALGHVGLTGRTTGPHLHFEVREHGRPIDPEAAYRGLKIVR